MIARFAQRLRKGDPLRRNLAVAHTLRHFPAPVANAGFSDNGRYHRRNKPAIIT
jgi:hypothetical protein